MNKFYGIGVGVGNPEMLTLKAVKTLKNLDVIILPEAKKGEGSTAYTIAKEFIKPEVQELFLEFPMVKDLNVKIQSRKNNAKIISELLDQGKNVGFLTIGDPMVYSTYSYILEYLDEKYSVETVCGIPSFVDMASLLNIPLTLGEESLKVISLNPEVDIKKEIENSDNIVFMKLSKNFPELKRIIKESGYLQNAVVVCECGKPEQKIYFDLEEITEENLGYFATLILKKGGISQWKKFIS